VSTLASAYSERRTNRLLAALAVLALISMPKDLFEGNSIWRTIYNRDLLPNHWLYPASVIIMIALGALYFFKRGGSIDRDVPRNQTFRLGPRRPRAQNRAPGKRRNKR